MVTLIRWLMLKSTQTKCRLAFWRLMEQLVTEAVKRPGMPPRNHKEVNRL